MRLGFHVSIAGGWQRALQRAVQRRCTTLQVFTSSPVQWARFPLDREAAAWFRHALVELDIQPLFVHGIYLLNLASDDRSLRRRSWQHLATELDRAHTLGAVGVVVHLGSTTAPEPTALRRVSRALDEALSRCDSDVRVLLENCAGQGNLVGSTPGSLAAVVAGSKYPHRLQVCLDLAHAFAQGYPVHEPEGLHGLLDELDREIGLDRLALIHANDSRAPLGSRLDRHWHIGRGHIGRQGFAVIMNEPQLSHLPFIMETPASDEWDLRNLRALRMAVRPEARPPLPRVRSWPLPLGSESPTGRLGCGPDGSRSSG